MASQGPNSPGTPGAVGGSLAHSNMANVLASDDTYATRSSAASAGAASASNFGFSIPAGATITGCLVEGEWSVTAGDDVVTLGTTRVFPDIEEDTDFYTFPVVSEIVTVTDAYYGSGGDGELGLPGGAIPAWSPNMVNSSAFGFVMFWTRDDEGANVTVRCDHLRVTIYYTEAGARPALMHQYRLRRTNACG